MQKNRLKLMCITGIFTALVYVLTAYLHIPSYNGYVHVGDAFIYLAACILPLPYAIFVGSAGAFLADSLTGYISWALGSVIIKALTAMCFSSKTGKILCLRNILALIPAGILVMGGYYLYEAVMVNNFITPLYGIPGNAAQWISSCILFVIMSLPVDKMNLRKKLY